MSSRRGGSLQLTPYLSDLLQRLNETARSFIELYEDKKERMQAIASELEGLSMKVNDIQDSTNTTRIVGAVFGGLGMAGVAAALLAGGSLVGEVPGKIALLGGTLALGGGSAAVLTANLTKAGIEKICLKSVEELGKDVIEITELHKGVLEDIMKVSEEFEKNSSSLVTTTKEQAKITLSETQKLQQLLRQTAELSQIPDSAMQCVKTVREFAKMRKTLKDFEETQRE